MFRKNGWAAKARRTVTAVLPIAKNRKGACIGCGKCCELPVKCPFLRKVDGKPRCSIYKLRPANCRKYPRTEGEWLTKNTCGYRFESENEHKN